MEIWSITTAAMIIAIVNTLAIVVGGYAYWKFMRGMFKDDLKD